MASFPDESIPLTFFSWDFQSILQYLDEGRDGPEEYRKKSPKKLPWSATQKVEYLRALLVKGKIKTQHEPASPSYSNFFDLCKSEIERLTPTAEREAARRQELLENSRRRTFPGFDSNTRLGYKPIERYAKGDVQTEEVDVPDKFTRKQVMALLDAFAPEFRDADNTAKAAFIVKLTPYNGEKNIAQEYSYLKNNEYADLVDQWKAKFRKSGRGRKKKTTRI